MTPVRVAVSVLLLAFAPAAALAQAGTTPLLAGPFPTAAGHSQFGGFVSIEDEFDVFALFRHGLQNSLDFGLRAGYTDVFGGGAHVGGDIRYGIPNNNPDMPLTFAVIGGFQASFVSNGNLLAFPLGVSIGAMVGGSDRAVLIYGLPRLTVERRDPDNGASNTDLEFAVEFGTAIELTPTLSFEGNLAVASNKGDNIALALGLSYSK